MTPDPITVPRCEACGCERSPGPDGGMLPCISCHWREYATRKLREDHPAAGHALNLILSLLGVAADLCDAFGDDFDDGRRLPLHWPDDVAQKVMGAGLACRMFTDAVSLDLALPGIEVKDFDSFGDCVRELAAESDRADAALVEKNIADIASRTNTAAAGADEPAAIVVEGGAT